MPEMTKTHIDQALTNISVAYIQEENAFIADKVFPIVPVQRQSDLYFVYDKETFFLDEAAERGNGEESKGGDYNVEQSEPYFCRVYAYHKDLTDRDRLNMDNPLNADRDAAKFVTQKLLLKRERDFVETFLKEGKWGVDVEGVESNPTGNQCIKWNKPLSNIISDIRKYKREMLENTGFEPNTLVLSRGAYDALCDHEDILDRIKYTQKGQVTKDLIASLLEVPNVYVSNAVYKTQKGEEGQMSFVSKNNALLCYVTNMPSLQTPSAGYIFAWTGLEGSGAYANRMVRIPTPLKGIGAERIEGEMAYDQRQIAKDMGIFFKNIVD